MRRRKQGMGAAIVKGAVAGAVATYAMDRMTTLLYEREAREAREREDRVRGGKTSYQVAAEKAAGMLGARLSDRASGRIGLAIHWGLGISGVIAYAAARRRWRALDAAQGLAFGTGFWAAVDEAMVPALGLTPGPTAFPWQTHARGLAGHLAYGAAAETTLDLLDRVA